MSKLVIIGIDSLEPTFVNELIERGNSKGFIQFKESGAVALLKSTFPPDTLLAWPTIYTGLLPHKFGLKPEPEDIHVLKEESIRIRNKLMGITFWDIASRKNKKVLIINPIFSYPPWNVRGVMISGPCFGLKGKTLSQPLIEYVSEYKLGTYGKTPLLPHEYKLVWNEALDQLATAYRLVHKMINEDTYDLVFFAEYTLDRIQHYYWNLENSDDILRPIKISGLHNAIMNYYKLLDSMIYWLMKRLGDEYTFIVLGDHGHKERPRTLVALDDILNQCCKGFNIREVFKHIMYMALHHTGLSNTVYYFIKRLQEKGLLGRLIRKPETPEIAYMQLIETLWEFGLKDYTGIRVKGIINKDSKNKILTSLSKILMNSGIAEFAVTPSQYYGSSEVSFDADLYVKLADGLGNMLSRGSFRYLPNYTRKIIRGGHSMYSLFLIHGLNRKYEITAPVVRVQDIAPSVLHIAGVHIEDSYFDGTKVIKNV